MLACGHPLRRQTSPLQLSRTMDSGLPHGWPLLKEPVRPSSANKESSAILPGGGSVPPRPLWTARPLRRSFLGSPLRLGHSCCPKRVRVAARCSPPYPRGLNTTWAMTSSVSPCSAACVCHCPPLPACVAAVGSSTSWLGPRLRHSWGPRAPRCSSGKGRRPNLPRSGRAGCNRRLPPRLKPGAAHH